MHLNCLMASGIFYLGFYLFNASFQYVSVELNNEIDIQEDKFLSMNKLFSGTKNNCSKL
jgi:hypothetical protein